MADKHYYGGGDEYCVPKSVALLVRAIVADYDRRNRAIALGLVSGSTFEQYVKLNAAVDSALESVEIGLRRPLLDDIAAHRGYDASPINYLIAKNTYYRRRYKVVYDVALRLCLI